MAQRTSGEFESDFIDGLRAKTGSDLAHWIKVVDEYPSKKRNEVIAWLKTGHRFGHMDASLLAGIHANGGKPVYANTADLLENQFSKAGEMRALYEAFISFISDHFPDATVLPKKTYVSVLENREFGAVNIKPKELRIGLDLGDTAFDERLEKAKLTGPMPRISHMVVIRTADDLDERLVSLLRGSHSRCHCSGQAGIIEQHPAFGYTLWERRITYFQAMEYCEHVSEAGQANRPRSEGCEDCLKTGDSWVHLRLCRSRGHVGCCDSSKNRHATKHLRASQHPVISSLEPGEEWGYCYIDDAFYETLPSGEG